MKCRVFLLNILLLLIFPLFADSPAIRFIYTIEALKFVLPYVSEAPIIFEAGAFDGRESVGFLKYWPNAAVHSFEPFPDAFQQLKEATHAYSNIHTYNLAISDRIGTSKFYISEIATGLGQSSSLYPPKEHLDYAPYVHFNKTVEVETTTIDDWAAQQHIDHIDLMWLDMQGYELQALKAAPIMLKTVKAIVTEVEFVEAYASQPLYKDVKEWLEKEGFEMIGTNFDPLNFTDHRNKTKWYGDALFIKKELLKNSN